MIITKLKGGLGNQMFQYAAGRRLAHMLGVPLKLDITYYHGSDSRSYLLSSFNVRECFATGEEIDLLTRKPHFAIRILKRLAGRPQPLSKSHIREKFFHFDSTILALPDNIYLEGYWQSDKYFSDIASIIREEFSPVIKLSPHAEKMWEDIESCNSIAVHIRRSDYAYDPTTRKFHGVCGPDYYSACIKSISIPDPVFFLFSDDLAWVKENIVIKAQAVFVETGSPIEDFWLMRCCRHHIIANSTFSWWSAWLQDLTGTITFVPKQWFNKPSVNTNDLFPPSWIRM